MARLSSWRWKPWRNRSRKKKPIIAARAAAKMCRLSPARSIDSGRRSRKTVESSTPAAKLSSSISERSVQRFENANTTPTNEIRLTASVAISAWAKGDTRWRPRPRLAWHGGAGVRVASSASRVRRSRSRSGRSPSRARSPSRRPRPRRRRGRARRSRWTVRPRATSSVLGAGARTCAWIAGVEALKRPGPVSAQAAMAPVVSRSASTAPSWTPPAASAFSSRQGRTRRERPPCMCSTRSPSRPMKGVRSMWGPISPGSRPPGSACAPTRGCVGSAVAPADRREATRHGLALRRHDLHVDEADLLAAAQQAGLRQHLLADRRREVRHLEPGRMPGTALGPERRARQRLGRDRDERRRDAAVERLPRVRVAIPVGQAQTRARVGELGHRDAERGGVGRPLGPGADPVEVGHARAGRRQEWIDSSPGISRPSVRIAVSASRSANSWVCMRSTGTRRASSSRMASR